MNKIKNIFFALIVISILLSMFLVSAASLFYNHALYLSNVYQSNANVPCSSSYYLFLEVF